MGYRVIIALLLLPILPLKAQINVGIATGPHVHWAAIGVETDPIDIKDQLVDLDITARIYAAPFDRFEQKYFAGPQILLFKNPSSGFNIYGASNVSLKKTPWNWDWGLLSGLGARYTIKRYTLFLEYQSNIDFARGPYNSIVVEGVEIGLMFGVGISLN